MIINHNLSALNTLNALGKNNQATNKSLQKLSTGYRINGASDDAAGLAISEKMRGQISGLKQASANAQDGISLLQTAEGGLDQTHSILQRMRELAVQSASDTNTTDDRQKIQSEVDQLAKEISRISNTTEFNTQNLLAGGLSDTFHIGANANQNINVSVSAMDAKTLGVAGNIIVAATVAAGTTGLNISNVSRSLTNATTYTISVTAVSAATYSRGITQTYTNSGSATGQFAIAAITGYTGTVDANYLVKVASVASDNTTVNSITYSTDNGTSWTTVNGDFSSGAGVTIDGMKITVGGATIQAGDTYSFGVKAAYSTIQLKDGGSNNVGSAVTVHKGDTAAVVGDSNLDQTVSLQFKYDDLGVSDATFISKQVDSTAAVLNNRDVAANASVVAGINVSTQKDANTAITSIDKAINAVSAQRSQLGAYQNRLTNTIDNLNTSNENITASESRIRDVDMSSEMMNYQKNNILQQAATAMLAKANQQPQSVLQLLQG